MSNYACKFRSSITKPRKSKDWIINPILNCCKINIPKKHVCHLSSSSDIRVNKDLSISSVYMLKHFNKLFNVTQEENISVFNKNIIFFLLSIKLWVLMWGECMLCQKLLHKGWPCDKSTGYKMANTLAGSFFLCKERWISIQIQGNLKICMW